MSVELHSKYQRLSLKSTDNIPPKYIVKKAHELNGLMSSC